MQGGGRCCISARLARQRSKIKARLSRLTDAVSPPRISRKLKLRRLVLNPRHKSRYGRIRREPRREALSTLEAVALLLQHLDGGPEIAARLLRALDSLIAEARPSRQPEGERVNR